MTLQAAFHNGIARLSDILPWTIPLKLMFAALLGVLGGAGLLGVLSEYATYSYAIYFGFRPPLEGIPYLKATVALGSFVVLLTGALVFALSIVVVKTFLWAFEWAIAAVFGALVRIPRFQVSPRPPGFAHVIARFRARPLWQVLLLAAAVSVLTAPITYFEADFLNQFHGKSISPVRFSTAMTIAAFLLTTALANERAIWWLAGAATFGYFIGWLVILFSPHQYSGFLRLVGYGGGIPVVVELREDSGRVSSPPQSYFLMLRTTEALLLLNDGKDSFVEIPRDQLKRVMHGQGGLRSLPYQLPTDR